LTYVLITDETGTIQLPLWNKQIDEISVGDPHAFERRFWREDEQDELDELCDIPVDDLEAEN